MVSLSVIEQLQARLGMIMGQAATLQLSLNDASFPPAEIGLVEHATEQIHMSFKRINQIIAFEMQKNMNRGLGKQA